MEVSSVQNLCKHLIFCAIQRCRMSDDLCRLSIVLKPFPEFNPPVVRLSVSDTGVGSNLEEFKAFKCAADPVFASKWDGIISIITTSISDNEIHNFSLNIKETVSSRRLTKLSSTLKSGAKFSGTEATLSTTESLNDLLKDISSFLSKMLILKIPRVAVELLVDSLSMPGSQSESCVLAVECSPLPSAATNIERLQLGLEEYVLKHGNILGKICQSCFSTSEHLKVGTGMAGRLGTVQSKRRMMEAVVIVSEASELAPSCCRPHSTRTEVLFFKDFTPYSITQSSLGALTSIKWKDYGLTLKSIADEDDITFLEWENLPPNVHIDIVLHCYYEEKVMIAPTAGSSQEDRTVTRKSLKLALCELKEKNDGALLSDRALKIRNYAPDLAKTIAGLVLSSYDLSFKEECFSLLGLQFHNIEASGLENCIKEKIVSAISFNDRKPQRSREPAAVLFEDDCFQLEFQDEEYEEGEEISNSLDL